MIRSLFLLLILIGLLRSELVCAELPPLSFVITASAETTYGEIIPLVEEIRSQGINEIDFVVRPESIVTVTIRIRSDIKVTPRADAKRTVFDSDSHHAPMFITEDLDEIAADLKQAGADEVTIETVDIFPRTDFSLAELSKLRRDGETVAVICTAAWDVDSARLTTDVLEDSDLIRRFRASGIKALMLDFTGKPADDIYRFVKQHNAGPLTVLVFRRGSKAPEKLSGHITAEAFTRHVIE